MTSVVEQPNTAAIRAMLWTGLDVETALELCDALDAARGEVQRVSDVAHGMGRFISPEAILGALRDVTRESWQARAEAAEKNLGRWQDKAGENLIRAKVAEAERDEIKGLLDDHSRREVTRLMAYKQEKARAEAAEARIAAALDVAGHDFYQSEAQRLARDVRRALTEGTGQ